MLNVLTYRFKIAEDILVRESEYAQSILLKFLGSSLVIELSTFSKVAISINFNHKFESGTVEIYNELIDGSLTMNSKLKIF